MLGFFKNKSKGIIIYSPWKGKVVPITEVPDPKFSEKILGDGFAVIPSDGKIYAPADGEIMAVFDTLHAITMATDKGTEILIHIGLDTVILKGEPFTAHISAGSQVKKGDLMMEADIEKIKAAGFNPITPILIGNTEKEVPTEMVEIVGVRFKKPGKVYYFSPGEWKLSRGMKCSVFRKKYNELYWSISSLVYI